MKNRYDFNYEPESLKQFEEKVSDEQRRYCFSVEYIRVEYGRVDH